MNENMCVAEECAKVTIKQLVGEIITVNNEMHRMLGELSMNMTGKERDELPPCKDNNLLDALAYAHMNIFENMTILRDLLALMG